MKIRKKFDKLKKLWIPTFTFGLGVGYAVMVTERFMLGLEFIIFWSIAVGMLYLFENYEIKEK
jgi:hypothetical protein